jgi:hypothetical protein
MRREAAGRPRRNGITCSKTPAACRASSAIVGGGEMDRTAPRETVYSVASLRSSAGLQGGAFSVIQFDR